MLLLLLLLSHFSHARLCVTPKTAAHQYPPSLGFSRQEHWSRLPFPSPMHESDPHFSGTEYTVVAQPSPCPWGAQTRTTGRTECPPASPISKPMHLTSMKGRMPFRLKRRVNRTNPNSGEQSRVLSPNGRGGWTPLRPLRGLQEIRVAIQP